MDDFAKFVVDAITSDFDYFHNVYDFHFNLEKYIAPCYRSRIDAIRSGKIFEILSVDPAYTSNMRLQILSMFNLKPEFDYNINDKFLKFALIDESIIHKIISYLGAIVFREEIAKIISKKSLISVKDAIGEDVYNFVLKRAMVLKKRVPGYPFQRGSDLIRNIQIAGKKLFELAMSGMPQAVIDRFNLRFDIAYDIFSDENTEHATKSFELMKYVIITAMSDNAEVTKCL